MSRAKRARHRAKLARRGHVDQGQSHVVVFGWAPDDGPGFAACRRELEPDAVARAGQHLTGPVSWGMWQGADAEEVLEAGWAQAGYGQSDDLRRIRGLLRERQGWLVAAMAPTGRASAL